MKKRVLSLLMVLVLCLTLLPTAALAAETATVPLDDISPDGKITAGGRQWTGFIIDGTTDLSGNKTFIVKNDVTINGDLMISDSAAGSPMLILYEGATLTVNGSLILNCKMLSIFGSTPSKKTSNSGVLSINSTSTSDAAIKSTYADGNGSGTTIFCYGGKVTATSESGVVAEKVHLMTGDTSIQKCSIDGEVKLPEDWVGPWFNTLGERSLTIEYCTHEDATYTSLNATQHQKSCLDCGFKWAAEDHNTNLVAYKEYDDSGHKLMCLDCLAVSSTATAPHTLMTAPTDDGKGHTTRCTYCAYTAGDAVEPHDTAGKDGACSVCGFKPVAFTGSAEDPDALYDSLQTAFETVADGSTITLAADITSGENITFGEYYDDETDEWVKPGYSATLVMDGHTLTGSSGEPALTVSGGSLTIADNATLEGRESLSSEIPATPAVKVTDGSLTFKGTVNATGGSGSSSAAPAIEVTGGKVTFEGKVTATGGLLGLSDNPMSCEPAIKATGGELEFNGDLDLNGGLTITGDATLTKGLTQGKFRVEYLKEDGKTKETVNGYTVSVEGSTVYKNDKLGNVNKLLADNHIFVKLNPTDVEDKYLSASYESLGWNVTIEYHKHEFKADSGYECVCGVKCDHRNAEGRLDFSNDGKCPTCGKPCDHHDSAQSPNDYLYYCRTCEQKMVAQNTKGTRGDLDFSWAYFTNLNDAMAAATEDGWTVKLLDDVDNSGKTAAVTGDNKTVTLDLNGKNITGGWIDVGRDQDGKVINSSRLNITGSGGFDGMIGISAKGTLDLSDWDGGTIKTVSSSQNGSEESTLISGENKGTITSLQFYSWPSGKITNTKLTGGTYGSIPISMNSGVTSISFSDLLAPGYAFQYADGSGSFVNYATKATYDADGVIYNVKVVKCTTHVDAKSVDADGNITDGADNLCDYCNADLTSGMVATLTVDGSTYFYTDLSAAAEKASTTGGTIQLLQDVTDVAETLNFTGSNTVIFDLNGHSITKPSTAASESGPDYLFLISGSLTMTIRDTSDAKTGKIETNVPGGYPVYSNSGALIIEGGEFKGSKDETLGSEYAVEAVNRAVLEITGGTFNSPVNVYNNSVYISGGTFTSLKTSDGKDIGSLLERYYTFQSTSGAWLTEAELAGNSVTNVTAVEAPIHSVQLKATKMRVEYGHSEEVQLTFAYKRPGGSDMNKKVTTTWFQVEDGVPKDLQNQQASYTLPAKLAAGAYTYRITITDNDTGYTVSSNTITITVTKADLSKAVISTTPDKTAAYVPAGLGKAEVIIESFVVNGITLADDDNGLDTTLFTVSGNEGSNVGTYTLKIEPTSSNTNFTGVFEKTWQIVPHEVDWNGYLGSAVKTYDGTDSLTVSGFKFKSLVHGMYDSSTEGESPINKELANNGYEIVNAHYDSASAGDAKTIYFTVKLLNSNYTFEDGSKTKDFTLNKANNVDCRIDKADAPTVTKTGALTIVNGLTASYTVDLTELLPTLTAPCQYGEVTYGNPEFTTSGLAEGESYSVISSVNKDGVLTFTLYSSSGLKTDKIGTVTIPVTTTNYEGFSLTVNVSAVNKPQPTVTATAEPDTIIYGTTLADITLTATATHEGSSVPGTITWDAPSTMPDAGKDQEFGWTFTPEDENAYRSVSGKSRITVEPATPTGEPKYKAIEASGKKLSDAALAVNESWPAGSVKWVDANGSELAANTEVKPNTAYRWIFTPDDSNNYNAIEGKITLYHYSVDIPAAPTYPVNAPDGTANGSVSISPKNAPKGSTVTITVKPDDGYQLGDLSATDKDGNQLPLTDKGDGKYTFVMPNGTVNVRGSFVVKTEESPFRDVSTGAYYYDAVKWAVGKDITSGIGNDLFGPNQSCTRAQIVTFLWRAAGSPEPTALSSFTDVAPTAYYAKAVAWAVENGVTTGTSATEFSPNEPCTRAQAVTFLYRALKAAASGSSTAFSDVAADAYYVSAVAWAVENGVTTGVGGGLFAPKDICTRAQIVTFLYRAYQGK